MMNERTRIKKNKLRTFRKFKLAHEHDYKNYVTNVRNINHRVAVTKLRLSNHKLATETGRYVKPYQPPDQRICPLCKTGLEDEEHFLMNCIAYRDPRRELFNTLKKETNLFLDSMTPSSAFATLISMKQGEKTQKIVAKYYVCALIAFAKKKDALNITLSNCINSTNVHLCNYCTKIFVKVVNTCVCRCSVDNKAVILSYPILSYSILRTAAKTKFGFFSFFLIHLKLKRYIRSYTPSFPRKLFDSRPEWAKSIPVLRPKQRKTSTLWGSTYLCDLYKGVPLRGE